MMLSHLHSTVVLLKDRLYLTFRFYIDGEETDVTIEGNNNNG